jgi:MFS family permease
MSGGVSVRALGQIAISILFVSLVGMGFTLLTPILSTEIESGFGHTIALSIPTIGLDLDLSGYRSTLLGLNLALGGIANLFSIPLVPTLVGRFGAKRIAMLSTLSLATCMVAFSITSFWVWFPLRFIFHMFLGSLFVITEYWVLSDSPPRLRGRVIGLYGTFLGLGFAIGPSILPLSASWKISPFYFCLALFVAAASVLLLKVERPMAVDKKNIWMMATVFKTDPAVVLAGLMFGIFEFGAGSLIINFTMRIGYTSAQSITVLSLLFLSNVCFQIPLGILSDKFNRRRLLAGISIVGFCGSAVLLYRNIPYAAFCVIVFLWSGSMAGFYTIGLAQSASQFDESDFVHVNALFVTLYSVGMIVGPLLIGFGMDAESPMGFAYTLMAMFGLYLSLLLSKRPKLISTLQKEAPHDSKQ